MAWSPLRPNLRTVMHASRDARGLRYAGALVASSSPLFCKYWLVRTVVIASYDSVAPPLRNMRAMIHASFDARGL